MDCKANQDTGIHFEASGWPAGKRGSGKRSLSCRVKPHQSNTSLHLKSNFVFITHWYIPAMVN